MRGESPAHAPAATHHTMPAQNGSGLMTGAAGVYGVMPCGAFPAPRTSSGRLGSWGSWGTLLPV